MSGPFRSLSDTTLCNPNAGYRFVGYHFQAILGGRCIQKRADTCRSDRQLSGNVFERLNFGFWPSSLVRRNPKLHIPDFALSPTSCSESGRSALNLNSEQSRRPS
jgi:hypothetical protein